MLELLVAADLVRKKTTKAIATDVPSRTIPRIRAAPTAGGAIGLGSRPPPACRVDRAFAARHSGAPRRLSRSWLRTILAHCHGGVDLQAARDAASIGSGQRSEWEAGRVNRRPEQFDHSRYIW